MEMNDELMEESFSIKLQQAIDPLYELERESPGVEQRRTISEFLHVNLFGAFAHITRKRSSQEQSRCNSRRQLGQSLERWGMIWLCYLILSSDYCPYAIG